MEGEGLLGSGSGVVSVREAPAPFVRGAARVPARRAPTAAIPCSGRHPMPRRTCCRPKVASFWCRCDPRSWPPPAPSGRWRGAPGCIVVLQCPLHGTQAALEHTAGGTHSPRRPTAAALPRLPQGLAVKWDVRIGRTTQSHVHWRRFHSPHAARRADRPAGWPDCLLAMQDACTARHRAGWRVQAGARGRQRLQAPRSRTQFENFGRGTMVGDDLALPGPAINAHSAPQPAAPPFTAATGGDAGGESMQEVLQMGMNGAMRSDKDDAGRHSHLVLKNRMPGHARMNCSGGWSAILPQPASRGAAPTTGGAGSAVTCANCTAAGACADSSRTRVDWAGRQGERRPPVAHTTAPRGQVPAGLLGSALIPSSAQLTSSHSPPACAPAGSSRAARGGQCTPGRAQIPAPQQLSRRARHRTPRHPACSSCGEEGCRDGVRSMTSQARGQ